jgi:hypothetical protein
VPGKDINPTGDSFPQSPGVLGGTRGGTSMVRDIALLGGDFSADDGAAHHDELWKPVPPL